MTAQPFGEFDKFVFVSVAMDVGETMAARWLHFAGSGTWIRTTVFKVKV